MYYLPFKSRGFSSVGKLFNYLNHSDIKNRLGVKEVYDSFGNRVHRLVEFISFDPNRLHQDLIIERNGSEGRVLVKRYLASKDFFALPSKWITVICDPPVELCKIQIY